ncbi:MAG: glycosyltransferase family 2 protein [Clostridium sp.]
MNKKVSIILLNYCGVEDTLNCVESLEDIDYDNYEIIIVENASPDNSYELLQEALNKKSHVLIKAPSNEGFAVGNNIGIKYAMANSSDYVLLLNNDTLVDKSFLKELVRCYEESENPGIIGSKILYESRREVIWYGGGDVNLKRFYGYHYGEGEIDKGQYNIEGTTNFITGCVMLIGREIIEKVGMLPTEYFMYFEDVDYCMNVRNHGYKLYYCPKSVVYHKVSGSTGGEESVFCIKWGTRNRIIFMDKFRNNVSKMEYFKSKTFFYLTRILKFLKYIISGNVDKAKALLEGIKEGLKVVKI